MDNKEANMGNKEDINSNLIKEAMQIKVIKLKAILFSSSTECSSNSTGNLCINSSSTSLSQLCMVNLVYLCLLFKHLHEDQPLQLMVKLITTTKIRAKPHGINLLACLKSMEEGVIVRILLHEWLIAMVLDDSQTIVHAFWCWCVLDGVGSEMMTVVAIHYVPCPVFWMLTASLFWASLNHTWVTFLLFRSDHIWFYIAIYNACFPLWPVSMYLLWRLALQDDPCALSPLLKSFSGFRLFYDFNK